MAGTIPMVTNVQRGRQVVPQMALLSPSVIASSYARVIGATESFGRAVTGLTEAGAKFGTAVAMTYHQLQEKAQDERDKQAMARFETLKYEAFVNTKEDFLKNPPKTQEELDERIRTVTNDYKLRWFNEFAMKDETVQRARVKTKGQMQEQFWKDLTNMTFQQYSTSFRDVTQTRQNAAKQNAMNAASAGDLDGFFAYEAVASENYMTDEERQALRVKAANAYVEFSAADVIRQLDGQNDEIINQKSPEIMTNLFKILDLNGDGEIDENEKKQAEAAQSRYTDKVESHRGALTRARQTAEKETKESARAQKDLTEQARKAYLRESVEEVRKAYCEEARKGREANLAAFEKGTYEMVDSPEFFEAAGPASFLELCDGNKTVARGQYRDALRKMFSDYSSYVKACRDSDEKRWNNITFNQTVEIIDLITAGDDMKLFSLCSDANLAKDSDGKYKLTKVTVVPNSESATPAGTKPAEGNKDKKPVLDTGRLYEIVDALSEARKTDDIEGAVNALEYLSTYSVREGDMAIIRNVLSARQIPIETRMYVREFIEKAQPYVASKAGPVDYLNPADKSVNVKKAYIDGLNELCVLLRNDESTQQMLSRGGGLRAEFDKFLDKHLKNLQAATITESELAQLNSLRMQIGKSVERATIKKK